MLNTLNLPNVVWQLHLKKKSAEVLFFQIHKPRIWVASKAGKGKDMNSPSEGMQPGQSLDRDYDFQNCNAMVVLV